MGIVYEAVDQRLDRRVALKVLHPHFTILAETRDRLLKEARLAARVEHENVVRIYNVHEVEGGLCLEMEYVDGVPLSQLIAEGPMATPRAVDLLHQVLEALAACHAKDVIHADLKPANLLVTPEGKVLLADFGISRAAFPEDGAKFSTVTRSGVMWGTPQYAPPEAWNGGLPDTGWDLYALGVLVHEALCGALPFTGETPAMMMREKLEGKRIPIAEKRTDLSAELLALIDSLCAGEDSDRPASAKVALERLWRTPEFRTSAATTNPLQHAETPTPGIAISLLANTSSPGEFATKGGRGKGMGALIVAAVILVLLALVGVERLAALLRGPVREASIAAVGNVGEILDLVATDDYGVYSYDDGHRGRELWLVDVTGRTNMVSDINPGEGSSNPHGFMPGTTSGLLMTASTEAQGSEPWLFESNPPQVRILKDIVRGPMHSNPKAVAVWSNLYFFHASTLNEHQGMWVSDKHHERTGWLRDIYPDAAFLDNRNTPVFVDGVGMYSVQRVESDFSLYRYRFSDGLVENLGKTNPDVRDLAMVGNRVVIAMSDPEVGFELWWTDDVNKETQLLKDIWPGTESGDPMDFYVWNGALYFRANSPEHGVELWKSDGTPEGTVVVHDLSPKALHGAPSNFVGTPDRLFFRANDERHGEELWATTGVPGSEARLFDLWPGQEPSVPYSIALIGHYLCFSANDGVHGEEFWALDIRDEKNEPYLLSDIRPGPDSSEPHSLTRLNDESGFFVYKDGGGDSLMRVLVDGEGIKLLPCSPLPR